MYWISIPKPMNDAYIRIGMIAKPHGVNGALKLLSLTFDNSRFNALNRTFLEHHGEYSPVEVTHVQASSDSVIIFIAGVNDRNAAERLRGAYICVPREEAATPPEGQFLIVDLIGCDVFDTLGHCYGKLTEVYTTGANDVYEITDGKRKLMIPALKSLLNTVNVIDKRIVLDADVLAQVGLFED